MSQKKVLQRQSSNKDNLQEQFHDKEVQIKVHYSFEHFVMCSLVISFFSAFVSWTRQPYFDPSSNTKLNSSPSALFSNLGLSYMEHMPVIPTHGRQRQEDHRFKACLDYIVRIYPKNTSVIRGWSRRTAEQLCTAEEQLVLHDKL